MNGVSLELDGHLACLTLCNPAANNTLSLVLLEQMLTLLDTLPTTTRALLLRSSAAIFSYGLSFDDFNKQAGQGQQASASFALLLQRLHQLPMPTIALMQGPCKAGGLGLVAACDLILCTRAVTFQLSEALLGLLPANLSPYLLLRLSARKLLQLSLTIDEINADYAYQIGLADYLVEDNHQLEKLARKLLRNIFRCSPKALATMKQFRDQLVEQSYSQQCGNAEQLLAVLLNQQETSQAISALQNGELPRWAETFRPQNSLVLEK